MWILPPHLPHTRVRAGGYLPISPPCRMGTPASGCRPLPGRWPVLIPPIPHPLHPLPSPSPSPSPHAATPLSDDESRRRRCWCAPEGALAAAFLRPCTCCRCPLPRHRWRCCCAAREAKNCSDPPPSASSWLPLLPDMLGRSLRASKPACASCPDCHSPPLRTLLVRRERSLAAVRPSAVRVARALHALLRCPRTDGSSVRLLQCSTYHLPRRGGAAAGALPKAL